MTPLPPRHPSPTDWAKARDYIDNVYRLTVGELWFETHREARIKGEATAQMQKREHAELRALRASRAALPGSAPSRKEASRPSRAAPANARKVA
jgi:hypothetical protein